MQSKLSQCKALKIKQSLRTYHVLARVAVRSISVACACVSRPWDFCVPHVILQQDSAAVRGLLGFFCCFSYLLGRYILSNLTLSLTLTRIRSMKKECLSAARTIAFAHVQLSNHLITCAILSHFFQYPFSLY